MTKEMFGTSRLAILRMFMFFNGWEFELQFWLLSGPWAINLLILQWMILLFDLILFVLFLILSTGGLDDRHTSHLLHEESAHTFSFWLVRSLSTNVASHEAWSGHQYIVFHFMIGNSNALRTLSRSCSASAYIGLFTSASIDAQAHSAASLRDLTMMIIRGPRHLLRRGDSMTLGTKFFVQGLLLIHLVNLNYEELST